MAEPESSSMQKNPKRRKVEWSVISTYLSGESFAGTIDCTKPSMAAPKNDARESASSHSGELLLRTLSKANVCGRLSKRFPTVASALNVAALESSPRVSVKRVQCEFWNVLRSQIRAGDATFLRDLVGAKYYKFSDRFSEVSDWYKRKVSPLLLLSDVVFFSEVINPAFEHTNNLRQLSAPQDNVYIRSVKLPRDVKSQTLVVVAKECEQQAEQLKSTFDDQDYKLFWHGTSSVSAKGIVDEGVLRQSGVPNPEGHDFGVGVYAFPEVLHSLSFAVDRGLMQEDEKGRHGNPALLCMCLPTAMLQGCINVDNCGGLIDCGRRQDRENLQRTLDRVLRDRTECYTVDDLDEWQQFVKFCWLLHTRPAAFSDDTVFHGSLHSCEKVTETESCARPVRDADAWKQYCFASANILVENGCRYFFFELDIPDFFDDQITEMECDAAIKEALQG